jgi:D-alanine-D-alanine ligase
MKIGITFDLRDEYMALGYKEEETAEFDRSDTILAIEKTITSLGYETDRIGNFFNLTKRLLNRKRWDCVFNISEGLFGFGREALVPSLLDQYEIPYTFSDPMVLALTLHKAMAKRVIRDLGIPTPDFFVIERLPEDLPKDLSFPLFVKPVAEGTGKGVSADSKVTNASQLANVCEGMLSKYKQPVLVEKYLPGREFTVGITGTGQDAVSIGVMEIMLGKDAEPDVYSYGNKEYCEELVTYRMIDDAEARQTTALALDVWRGLGCKDAGRIDFRVDENGTPNFMEINPLAGLHPEHSDLCIIASMAGITYKELIASILDSAFKRYTSLKKRSGA